MGETHSKHHNNKPKENRKLLSHCNKTTTHIKSETIQAAKDYSRKNVEGTSVLKESTVTQKNITQFIHLIPCSSAMKHTVHLH